MIEGLLAFNRQSKPAERFDGIVLDIEPFLLSAAKKDEVDWQKDQPEIWRIYLEVLDGIAQQVRNHNNSTNTPLILSECIPPWYESRQNDGRANFEDVIDPRRLCLGDGLLRQARTALPYGRRRDPLRRPGPASRLSSALTLCHPNHRSTSA